MTSYFKTKNRLQVALHNLDRVGGLEDLLDDMFTTSNEIPGEHNEIGDAPYCVTEMPLHHTWNGRKVQLSLDSYEPQYGLETRSNPYLTDEQLDEVYGVYVQRRNTYYEPCRLGQVLEVDGVHYIYVGSHTLPEEVEHQANDGGLAYEYRGTTYLRVLVQIEEIDGLNLSQIK